MGNSDEHFHFHFLAHFHFWSVDVVVAGFPATTINRAPGNVSILSRARGRYELSLESTLWSRGGARLDQDNVLGSMTVTPMLATPLSMLEKATLRTINVGNCDVDGGDADVDNGEATLAMPMSTTAMSMAAMPTSVMLGATCPYGDRRNCGAL